MSIEQTIEAIWTCHQTGVHFPEQWRGKLSLDEAYRVQQGILQRRLAGGAHQAGWKVGLTADPVRKLFGASAPVFGYLLEENRFPSGHAFASDRLSEPAVESEVIVTLGQALAGPGVTVEQARAAVKEIAPAFEIIARRGGDLRSDLGLGVADNVMQAAFVVGSARPLRPQEDLGEIRAEVWVNGKPAESVLGREVMDNPLRSLVWLANALPAFGAALQAGHRVLTGSFTKPIPAGRGDRFETRFSGLGSVAASFA
jgi:2-keto-4-pentenoate hydratase